ncbi:Diaminopimelate epimerase-like protein [Linderina pennispora]|uniref:Diaminopimelate epimerase-like protein n=1 Tax=Linderina pennispora TaxID=61395 RepID=A0A1Y1VXA1_9FUNG|nr:Diaminopimelate epimerase-like protein [Linderina pennispora]ORX65928.1 Diaminopimelate epimerase-like protein [Linderina pennispora]
MALELRVFIIDAFTAKAFGGNPAAVVLLPASHSLNDSALQQIASELNQPMTAFLQPSGADYTLQWFNARTKGRVLMLDLPVTTLHSPVGALEISRRDELLTLRLPSSLSEEVHGEKYQKVLQAFMGGRLPTTATVSFHYAQAVNDLVVLIEGIDEAVLRACSLTQEFAAASQALGVRAVTFAVPGTDYDSLARVFHAGAVPDEDQVTGSAHTIIAPLFHKRFGKSTLRALQCSERGGELLLELSDDHVLVSGTAVTVLEGKLTV